MQLLTSHSDFAKNDQHDERLLAFYPCHYIFGQSAIFIYLRLFLFSSSCFFLDRLSLSLCSMRHPGGLDSTYSQKVACQPNCWSSFLLRKSCLLSSKPCTWLLTFISSGSKDTELCVMAFLLRRSVLRQSLLQPCRRLPYRQIHISLQRRSDALFVVSNRVKGDYKLTAQHRDSPENNPNIPFSFSPENMKRVDQIIR